ncbi:NAD(P)-dependent oxidoreductase [Clostridium estertheticum]|uniref:NAD(P)H-binding protein n=1 Tax=Clostridium estertheticum TaxID=238834 RepID=A0AA47I8A6_9CLOT|nr:NAD(P)H-binding protein [Clostridium estertheticum]MBU3155778.1 NAD(P)H-binding protein [Clostridium estertheticum]WAG62408.1 NAD(P)H-binding protein [Clostridium estertheticum]
MKVIIFGASGGIGKFAVQHALEKGYEAKAFLRDPSKLTIKHENLTTVQGEINNYNDIKNAIFDCDAVIWCVGIPMKKYKYMESLEGHKNLLKAMNECHIERLIDWATPSVHFKNDKKSISTVVPGFLAGILFPMAKKELINIADMITKSNLNWSIVRFMAPKDTPFIGNVKVGFGDTKMNFNISREDIGAFMVEQLNSNIYEYSMPIIGS